MPADALVTEEPRASAGMVFTPKFALFHLLHQKSWKLVIKKHTVQLYFTTPILSIDGFVQDCGIYSTLAMEIPKSFTKPLLWLLNFISQGLPNYHSTLNKFTSVCDVLIELWPADAI